MASAEFDVLVSYREPAGAATASLLEAALTRRGFRVYRAGVAAGSEGSDEATLAAIDRAPDFVAILTPDAVGEYGDGASVLGRQLAHATRLERNIIPVYMPGTAAPGVGSPGAVALSTYQAVVYAPHAREQSLARVAHRLTSTATREERHLSRQTKWMVTAVAAVLLFVAIGFLVRLFPHTTTIPPLPRLALATAVLGQRSEGGQWVEFPVEDHGVVKAGDQLRVALALNGDGYAYVLARDGRGDLSVLFPLKTIKADSRVKAGTVYQAPADGGWFTVDQQAGLQALYVIASYDSLENLESLMEEHDGESTPQERAATLTMTIGGLLDGRHAVASSITRTRKGRAIVQNTPDSTPVPTSFTTMLSSRVNVTRPLARQMGLLSVMSETNLRFER